MLKHDKLTEAGVDRPPVLGMLSALKRQLNPQPPVKESGRAEAVPSDTSSLGKSVAKYPDKPLKSGDMPPVLGIFSEFSASRRAERIRTYNGAHSPDETVPLLSARRIAPVFSGGEPKI